MRVSGGWVLAVASLPLTDPSAAAAKTTGLPRHGDTTETAGMATTTGWVKDKLRYLLFVRRLNLSVICEIGKGLVEALALKLHVSAA